MEFPRFLIRKRRVTPFFWIGVAVGAGAMTAVLAPFAAGRLMEALQSGAKTSKARVLRGMDAVAPVLNTASNWIEKGRERLRHTNADQPARAA